MNRSKGLELRLLGSLLVLKVTLLSATAYAAPSDGAPVPPAATIPAPPAVQSGPVKVPRDPDAAAPSASATRVTAAFAGLVIVPSGQALKPGGVPVPANGLDLGNIEPLMRSKALRAMVQERLGRPLSMSDLQQIGRQIVLAYRASNRPLVDVAVPEQDVSNGVVQLVVTEFKVGKIQVEGNKRTSDETVRRAIKQVPGEPLDQRKLIAGLNYLGANPFRRVDAVYRRADQPQTTDLVLKVTESRPFRVTASWDNSGTLTTNRQRIGAGVTWGDVLGGDGQLTLQLSGSPDVVSPGVGSSPGFQAITGSLIQPLSAQNSLITFATYQRAAPSLGPDLGQIGENLQFTVRLAHSFTSGKDLNAAVTFGYDFKQSNNNLLFGGTSISSQKTDIHQFTADLSFGLPAAGGYFSSSVMAVASPGGIGSRNTAEAFRPTATRAGTPFADARYAYLRLSAQHTLPLGKSGFELRSRVNAQASSGNLLPSEQLSAAGPGILRGYEPNAALGSRGLVLSGEVWTKPFSIVARNGALADQARLGLFIDAGWVGNAKRLAGEHAWTKPAAAGISGAWSLSQRLSVRADYGWQLTSIPGYAKGSLGYVSVALSL